MVELSKALGMCLCVCIDYVQELFLFVCLFWMNVERITGSKPSLSDVSRLMDKMDRDNDGVINLNEFTTTIMNNINKTKSTQNKIDSNSFDKKELHINIMNFFFDSIQKANNFDILKKKRLQVSTNLTPQLITQQQQLNENFKLDALNKCQKMAEKLSQTISAMDQAVGSNDVKTCTKCVAQISDCLSILSVYSSDDDRLKIAEFIVGVLFRKIDAFVAKRIVLFLKENNKPLQFQVCRFIVHFAQVYIYGIYGSMLRNVYSLQ